MKKTFLLYFLLGLGFIACNNQGPRVIERPVHGLKNTETLEIAQVELTDSATILHVDAYFTPGWWIRVDSGTYLQANGEKYLITGSKDIVLHQEHWMPQTGEDHFELYFPPLPKGTKSFDFIETDCDNCFKIWDIDLTGKPKAYKPGIPKEIINAKVDKTYELPSPEFKIGKTKVNLYVTGWREGFALHPALYPDHVVIATQEEVEGKSVGTTDFTFELDLYTTTCCRLRIGTDLLTIYLSPGEEANVYYDLSANSRKNSRYNPEPTLAYAGFKGKYAELNTILLQSGDKINEYARIDLYSDHAIPGMTAEQFTSYLLNQYNERVNRLQQEDIPEALKELITHTLKTNIVNYVTNMSRLLENIYRSNNKINYDQPIDYKAPVVSDAELIKLKELDLNDPTWLYASSFSSVAPYLSQIASSDAVFYEMLGAEQGLLVDLKLAMPAIASAASMAELTPEMKKRLQSTSAPYYEEVYNFIAEKTKRQYEAALKEGGFEMLKTPEVAAEKILDAIVAQYKGKAIFVDFWATWCGPCLNAMKTIKPFKPEMAEKGVVSIYISNASSPHAKWVSMLPEIGGLHYYLTAEQWKVIGDKYDIQGIPTYMIFDKSGKKTFETAGYPGNDKIREELSKVW
ncbi:thiol-disulfide isomerase/thioredoxin [Parabacteroides sp. PFB2-10]|uniref:thioredoxin-like domain-containing protein n=1 Tax=Parabacteroides sp. PFB2-10 TaxID=1742405 RepID=UPI0024736D62|nr:thioredoxin-like domain-containing protein [Parabacteroides sp. PFB2-10]MDH6311536.1 thiol-disulfide isomerase/thioredoxin [Parabacteroides sp. PFB2-10]MDL2244806.1 redoxin family protein [Parabacteroides sp. OttesenSCG-928-J18]